MSNREYKSDVFSMLLSDKKNALQVYNAVNGTTYDDPELVEMVSLNEGISLSIRNDASFILGMDLSFYEHQSTVNPNMPLRLLFYFTDMIEKIVSNQDLMGRRLIQIPYPRFVVFYNGREKQPEIQEYRLSSSFMRQDKEPQLELKCTVYNINNGNNIDLLDNCNVIKEYMIFVNYVREYEASYGRNRLEDAIFAAIDRCIEENVLKDFLLGHRAEVAKVTQLDYTFERRLELAAEEVKKAREEGKTEGIAQGIAEGISEGRMMLIRDMLKDHSLEEVSVFLNMPISDIEEMLK